MIKKALIFLFVGIFLFSLVSAEESGGLLTGTQYDSISLPQECVSCSYVYLTSIQYPNMERTYINSAMSIDGSSFSYVFNDTTKLGTYTYCGYGDVDGTDTTFCKDFEITPSGFRDTLGFYLIIIVVMTLTIMLGFGVREEWFVVLGGMGLIIMGIYSINEGVAGFRDMFMTWTIGLFEIGIGFILSVGAALQKIDVL